ncbi:ABC-type transport auxiliary lipoprotein family protein [Variovorax sp. OV329]|uniref:ABC-type transport auxiliary lipoprotein family protein n=1 Tax=Variovorax sp. OV329 TaxID=1882825 RepID=UPI0008E580B8|nr:ABC-type transport auxiliary lipoprotein family protein [Variovorax sp. OV329]SFN31949.1 cholesterol transport system auxiliary component [Variovorax sp. OV329]
MTLNKFTSFGGLACAGIVVASVLVGCGALPDKPARATLYDFGAGPLPRSTAAATASPTRKPPMLLSHIEAHARLDGAQILYRFGYSDSNELRPYSQARWSVPATQLLEQRLRDALSQRRVVLGTEEGTNIARVEGKVPNSLRLTLEEFSQYFDTPTSSYGLVRVRATLMNTTGAGDRVLGQRTFSAQEPALSADAPGGVRALAAASDAVVAQVVLWADELQQPAQ